jgi:two-component system, chemotaxis family, sensor kinase CheA
MLRQLALESSADAVAAAGAPAVVQTLVVPSQAVPLVATMAGAPATPLLKVCFSKVSANDCKLLSEELENLGHVTAQTQTDDSLTLWVETGCDAEDIIAVCCFVIEADQIKISNESAATVAAAPEIVRLPVPVVPPAPVTVSVPVAAAATIAPAAVAAPASSKESSSIRVDVEKVDQIINLDGELVITQSMLTQTAAALDPVLHERLLSGMGHLERNARDLQESVMSIRMMPMDYVFSAFRA